MEIQIVNNNELCSSPSSFTSSSNSLNYKGETPIFIGGRN